MPVDLVPGKDGRLVPGVLCDRCGQVIASAAEGNCYWPADAATGSVRVRFIHNRCSLAFEADQGTEAQWRFAPLRDLVSHLGAAPELRPRQGWRWPWSRD